MRLEEEIDGWDDFDDDERERVRELLRELGVHLDAADDPDLAE